MNKKVLRGKALAARRKTDSDVDAAARLTSKFHGRPARKATESLETVAFRESFASLGKLISLRVDSAAGPVDLTFGGRAPRVACSADGRQLYFLDGDQGVSLKAIGLPPQAARDLVTVGTLRAIVYETRKGFHNFEESGYRHEFGTPGGRGDLLQGWQRALSRSPFRFPLLSFDALNARLLVSGGAYTVLKEGIVF